MNNKQQNDLPDVDLSDAPSAAGDEQAASSSEQSASGQEQSASAAADEVAKLKAERDDFKDKWTRAVADLENYRKRTQRELDEFRRYQAGPIVRSLLPGLDNLDRAIEAAKSTGKAEDLIAGVEMVRKQFDDMLASLSVEQIPATGKPFDPNLHEALQQVPSEEPPMQVLQEVERGYRLHDRVIRPAKVIVSSGPPEQPPE